MYKEILHTKKKLQSLKRETGFLLCLVGPGAPNQLQKGCALYVAFHVSKEALTTFRLQKYGWLTERQEACGIIFRPKVEDTTVATEALLNSPPETTGL